MSNAIFNDSNVGPQLFSWVPVKDLGACVQMCKGWQKSIQHETQWKLRAERDYADVGLQPPYAISLVNYLRSSAENLFQGKDLCTIPLGSWTPRGVSRFHKFEVLCTNRKHWGCIDLTQQKVVAKYPRKDKQETRGIAEFAQGGKRCLLLTGEGEQLFARAVKFGGAKLWHVELGKSGWHSGEQVVISGETAVTCGKEQIFLVNLQNGAARAVDIPIRNHDRPESIDRLFLGHDQLELGRVFVDFGFWSVRRRAEVKLGNTLEDARLELEATGHRFVATYNQKAVPMAFDRNGSVDLTIDDKLVPIQVPSVNEQNRLDAIHVIPSSNGIAFIADLSEEGLKRIWYDPSTEQLKVGPVIVKPKKYLGQMRPNSLTYVGDGARGFMLVEESLGHYALFSRKGASEQVKVKQAEARWADRLWAVPRLAAIAALASVGIGSYVVFLMHTFPVWHRTKSLLGLMGTFAGAMGAVWTWVTWPQSEASKCDEWTYRTSERLFGTGAVEEG